MDSRVGERQSVLGERTKLSAPRSHPQISVVMSVHNCERYVEDAVQSILNQTFRDFEFIIINDGSTDQSGSLLEKLASSDSRIRLFQQENQGLTASLNRGLRLACGDLIARMDADDVARETRLDAQAKAFSQDNTLVLLGTEVELTTEDCLPLGCRGHALPHHEIRRRLLMGDGGALTHPAVMFKRELALKLGGYDERFVTCQDLDLFLKLSENGQVRNLPETLLSWRQHSGSVNRTRSQTWTQMKRLAIENTIDRIGIESYAMQLFPDSEPFSFPCSSYGLALYAKNNGETKTALRLLRRALKDPDTRASAIRLSFEILQCVACVSLLNVARNAKGLSHKRLFRYFV